LLLAAAAAFLPQMGGSRRPADTPFKQQTLKAWRPILTPRLVILLFSLVGVIFIPIGAIIISASNDVEEVTSDDYAGQCCLDQDGSSCSDSAETWKRNDSNPCAVTITLTNKMVAPVYQYYKLTNNYQNHRPNERARDDVQLKGDTLAISEIAQSDSCKYHVVDPSAPAGTSDEADAINPCGLIAWGVFNDSFSLLAPDGSTQIALEETGIAWPSDLKYKFKNNPDGSTGQHFPPFAYERNMTCADLPTSAQQSECTAANIPQAGWCYPGSTMCTEDEHFVIWMRAAGLPSFRKLYARINTDLDPGTYTFMVSNGHLKDGVFTNYYTGKPQNFLYPVSSFGGTKSIVLSTTTWIGGKNYFLGYAYVVVGVICIVLAICFLIKYRLSPRDLGSAPYITREKDS